MGATKGEDPGLAMGISTLSFDAPNYSDSLGSVEPRTLRTLKNGPLGQLGADIASDIERRMDVFDPQKLRTNKEISKTNERV